jgi:hypothetical protein
MTTLVTSQDYNGLIEIPRPISEGEQLAEKIADLFNRFTLLEERVTRLEQGIKKIADLESNFKNQEVYEPTQSPSGFSLSILDP